MRKPWHKITTLLRVGVALASLGTGCGDPQTGLAYLGEPLGSFHGVMQDQLPLEMRTENQLVVIWWQTMRSSSELCFDGRIQTSIDFSPNFTMDVYSPPPEEALGTVPGGVHRFSIGFVATAGKALESVACLGTFDELTTTYSLLAQDYLLQGLAEQHVLVYVPQDIPAGCVTADFFGMPLAAGLHLMNVTQNELPVECRNASAAEWQERGCSRYLDAFRSDETTYAKLVGIQLKARESFDWPYFIHL